MQGMAAVCQRNQIGRAKGEFSLKGMRMDGNQRLSSWEQPPPGRAASAEAGAMTGAGAGAGTGTDELRVLVRLGNWDSLRPVTAGRPMSMNLHLIQQSQF